MGTVISVSCHPERDERHREIVSYLYKQANLSAAAMDLMWKGLNSQNVTLAGIERVVKRALEGCTFEKGKGLEEELEEVTSTFTPEQIAAMRQNAFNS